MKYVRPLASHRIPSCRLASPLVVSLTLGGRIQCFGPKKRPVFKFDGVVVVVGGDNSTVPGWPLLPFNSLGIYLEPLSMDVLTMYDDYVMTSFLV